MDDAPMNFSRAARGICSASRERPVYVDNFWVMDVGGVGGDSKFGRLRGLVGKLWAEVLGFLMSYLYFIFRKYVCIYLCNFLSISPPQEIKKKTTNVKY